MFNSVLDIFLATFGILNEKSFLFCLGTQLLLCNPLCTPAFAYASWHFFDERVRDEECALVRFFGEEYIEYIKEVPTRIPFVHGLEDDIRVVENGQ